MKVEIFLESYCHGGVDTFVINLINSWPNDADKLILISNEHEGLEHIKNSIYRPCLIIKHKLKIFTGYFIKREAAAMIDNISLYVLKTFSFVFRYLFLIYNIIALKKIILSHNADRLMVVSGGYPGGDSARAAAITWGLGSKKPQSILVFFGLVSKPGWHIKLQESLVDILLAGLTKYFITDSKATAQTMCCRRFIHNKNKIGFIHDGITEPAYMQEDRPGVKTELDISINCKLCLMLGSYAFLKNYDKGHFFLIKAFKKVVAQIPSAHLLICGSGIADEIARVRRIVIQFNLEKNIHLLGFRTDVPFLLKQVDLLLVSSQAFESFGFTSIEAMSLGVPVVATNVGGIPEVVVDGQGGYCIDKNDIDSYAARIIKLLQDDNLRQEQGQKARQRYQEFFTAKRMAEKYYKIIHE